MSKRDREPERFRYIRERFGLTNREWGLALGYGGKPVTRANMLNAMERGKKPIPEVVWRLALCLDELGEVPLEWLVEPDNDAP